MSHSTLDVIELQSFPGQPIDTLGLLESERDSLIIAATKINGQWTTISRYGDNIWHLRDQPSNVPDSRRKINFDNVPLAFRAVMKAMMYRHIMRGRIGSARPKGGTTRVAFEHSLPFFRYLEKLNISKLSEISPIITQSYATTYKDRNANSGFFTSIEVIYELSQFTDQPMPQHPWPDTSAFILSGSAGKSRGGATPLIPDDVFCTLFSHAYQQLENSKLILDLRDELDVLAVEWKGSTHGGLNLAKTRYLKAKGWSGGIMRLSKSLNSLRTACYIVLASTSGCRNHELCNLQIGAHHCTEDDEGTIYHWMCSKSEKTDAGIIKWMIPEVGVLALRTMERWSTPYRALIAEEIIRLYRINPHHAQIAEAEKHRNSLFLSIDRTGKLRVRTLTLAGWQKNLQAFAKNCGLSWNLTSHQFRRKFANYVAHSKFGDLRYLKEHFAHWTLDMSLGYAMDDTWGQHLDLDLYDEIQDELVDIKITTVSGWIEGESLAGGYGLAIKKWQREPHNLLIFKDHAAMIKSIAESTCIRSNGHAWCTADSDACIGNTIERTRCSGCDHSVIGPSHAPMYQRLYNDLKDLRNCTDIGESGRRRVERDLSRSQEVLTQLGMPQDLIS